MAGEQIKTVTITDAITPVLPPAKSRWGYRLSHVSGNPVAFAYGSTGSTELTFANGDRTVSGDRVQHHGLGIEQHGVFAITASGTAVVSVEEYK